MYVISGLIYSLLLSDLLSFCISMGLLQILLDKFQTDIIIFLKGKGLGRNHAGTAFSENKQQ
ncbi:MAG: hypothetical protein VR69_08280 [Peptococcaceae bacterium BRH_c4b]|nr:MAG: hypothetical protein VR69_08280 [Peptococcaceae bacterium BRH_c4b]